MMPTFPRLMISAAHKSSGKTMVTTGLLAALRSGGHNVGAFKKGPDYIDPMWLSAAAGNPCYNLDFNTMEPAEISAFFQSKADGRDLSLIEANKGLYDGVDPVGSDANSQLAKLLGLPVVLVIDTLGMTRGIAPLLQGYCSFDPDVKIAGVILNKVGGERHEGKLRQAVSTYTDLPVLGAIQRHGDLQINERHLGLTTPAECPQQQAIVAQIASRISDSVDLEGIIKLASSADALAPPARAEEQRKKAGKGLRIGVVRDVAFGFYYPDDLEAFENEGAVLVPVDTIHDAVLPEIDGLFVGGGFPEMRMEQLAINVSMRDDIKAALEAGLPCYAECGGLMYMCKSLTFNGETRPMVGAIDGDAVMHARPQGRGYASFVPTPAHPWETMPNKAHEFHYASIENLADDAEYGRKMTRGAGIGDRHDAIVKGNLVAGFCHLRNTSTSPWVPRFLEFVQRCRAASKNYERATP